MLELRSLAVFLFEEIGPVKRGDVVIEGLRIFSRLRWIYLSFTDIARREAFKRHVLIRFNGLD